jgi:hypothetical protein
MKAAGKATMAPAAAKSSPRNWPSRRWNHQASISGMAIFRISEGWITMPILSQRVAPFLVMPNSAVASSSITPAVYSGTARAIRRCGGTCATRNIMSAASIMLRDWSMKREPLSKPTEYILTRPSAHRNTTMQISGRSKP